MNNNLFYQHLQQYTKLTIRNHLNYWFELQDRQFKQDYQAFIYDHRTYSFYFIFLGIVLICLCFESYLLYDEFVVSQLSINYLIFSCIYFGCLCGLAIVLICMIYSKYNINWSQYDAKYSAWVVIALTLSSNMYMIRNISYPCMNMTSEDYLGRNCHEHRLTWDIGACLFVTQIINVKFIQETRIWLLGISFITMFLTIFYLIYCYEISGAYSSLIYWSFICLCMIIQWILENFQSYFLSRKLIETLIENNEYNTANQAYEMRHLIANVAHDLKTPLTSFIAGVELIQDLVNECKCQQASPKISPMPRKPSSQTNQEQAIESVDQPINISTSLPSIVSLFNPIDYTQKIHSIEEIIEDIRNTNSFMLMTINRCIDYSKASKGLTLIPHYETINLQEIIRLPLNCMRNIQQRITIQLNPWSNTICSHIITDKQWLQENILCLLSNAVKYSSNGDVTITITLQSEYESKQRRSLYNNNDKKELFLLNSFKESSKDCSNIIDPTKHTQQSDTNSLESHQLEIKLIQKRFVPTTTTLFSVHNISKSTNENEDIDENDEKRERNHVNIDRINHNENTSLKEHSVYDVIPNQTSTSTSFTQNNLEYLLFEIEDNGIGLTPKQMSTLFNQFQQTQRYAGGTGLGLFALARRIEALNGYYGVRNRKDNQKGSLFWFEIPYKPDTMAASLLQQPKNNMSKKQKSFKKELLVHQECNDSIQPSFQPYSQPFSLSFSQTNATSHTIDRQISSEASEQTSIQALSGVTLPINSLDKQQDSPISVSSKKCVLLVDDAPSILKMTSAMLTKQGYLTDKAENGDIAVNMITSYWSKHNQPYHCVIMDLQMPVMDGLEATRRIRTLESQYLKEYTQQQQQYDQIDPRIFRPKQLIIGCSANSDAETIDDAYLAGVDGFIAKPFQLNSFHMMLTKLISEINK